jgi:putative redox protein
MGNAIASATVKSTGQPFAQKASAGGHSLAADVGPEHGGTASGFSPYELTLSALGACTNITVSMYAKRKELPLTGMEVSLSYHKPAEGSAFAARFERVITFEGALSDEQKQKLIEIAGKCPVAQFLKGSVEIVTTLA